jgi:hypothetical protein
MKQAIVLVALVVRDKAKGVVFVRESREESYGTVAVFEALYGNLLDLLQLKIKQER